jgi:hypothetical protein
MQFALMNAVFLRIGEYVVYEPGNYAIEHDLAIFPIITAACGRLQIRQYLYFAFANRPAVAGVIIDVGLPPILTGGSCGGGSGGHGHRVVLRTIRHHRTAKGVIGGAIHKDIRECVCAAGWIVIGRARPGKRIAGADFAWLSLRRIRDCKRIEINREGAHTSSIPPS